MDKSLGLVPYDGFRPNPRDFPWTAWTVELGWRMPNGAGIVVLVADYPPDPGSAVVRFRLIVPGQDVSRESLARRWTGVHRTEESYPEEHGELWKRLARECRDLARLPAVSEPAPVVPPSLPKERVRRRRLVFE